MSSLFYFTFCLDNLQRLMDVNLEFSFKFQVLRILLSIVWFHFSFEVNFVLPVNLSVHLFLTRELQGLQMSSALIVSLIRILGFLMIVLAAVWKS